MNKYHIRIDGVQSTDSYTYEELVDMDLFELEAEGIEVKNVFEHNFTPIRLYNFIEAQPEQSSYHIDEYGQIHRDNYVEPVTPDTPVTNTTSGASSSNENRIIFFKILGTLIVLAIAIPILIALADSGGTRFVIMGGIYGAYWLISQIWG